MAHRHAVSTLLVPITTVRQSRVVRGRITSFRSCPVHPLGRTYASSSTQHGANEEHDPHSDAEGRIALDPPSTQAVHTSLGQASFSNPDPSFDGSSNHTANSRHTTSSSSPRQKSGFIPPHVQERLSEWRAAVSQQSRHVAEEAERKFVSLGLKVNEMTGYKEVERLKALVFNKEDELQTLREAARSAKIAYEEAVSARSSAQRDVNSLLERKHSWTDSDVGRFTTLVRADHSSTHAVASTSVALKDAELAVDKAFSELMQTILQRYHEEQMWSDKIRSVSTYANLIGLALNLVIFVGAIAVVEPWKRKRLVERLEERMAGMMARVEERLGGVEGRVLSALPSLDVVDATSDAIEQVQPDQAPLLSDLDDVPQAVAPTPVDPAPAITPYPFLKTAIEGLPPYLDVVTQPSAERDLALAGIAGAIISATMIGVTRALAGK